MRVLPFFISLVCIGLLVLGVSYIVKYDNIYIFLLEYGVVPVLVIIIMTVFPHREISSPRAFVTTLAVFYGIVIMAYVIFTIFSMPAFIEKLSTSTEITKNNFKTRIKNNYALAKELKNKDEQIQYAKLYNMYFPDEELVYFSDVIKYTHADVKEQGFDVLESIYINQKIGSTIDASEETNYQRISDSINVLNYTNIGKQELLQIATDYVGDAKFYAAKLLLTQYHNRYGKTARSTQLERTIEEHIFDNSETSYDEQRRIQLQNQIQYLYTILSRDETNKDTITAYYQVIALLNDNRNDMQLLWLFASYRKRLRDTVFFASEARTSLLKLGEKTPVMFLEKGNEYSTVWIAKDVSYYMNTAYLENLELIRIQNNTASHVTAHDDIIWHIKTQYAKLIPGKVLLYSIEQNNLATHHEVQIIRGKFPEALSWMLSTSVRPKDVSALNISKSFIDHSSIIGLIFMISSWREYSLPVALLYTHILRDIFIIFLFIFIVLLLIKIHIMYADSDVSTRNRYFLYVFVVSAYLILKLASVYTLSIMRNSSWGMYVLPHMALITISIVSLICIAVLLTVAQKIFMDYLQASESKKAHALGD